VLIDIETLDRIYTIYKTGRTGAGAAGRSRKRPGQDHERDKRNHLRIIIWHLRFEIEKQGVI